jgi:Protein kinase domain
MTTLQDRYEFIETLGTGATSRVDKARDMLIGRNVALKTFLHGFGSRDVQELFLREAQIIGQLAHPCIVGLYDVGTDANGVPYFVMEYVEGQTLEKILDAGPLQLEKALVWAADLTAAIVRAHQAKVIHGDIKPANILITKDGQVKLGDFGIARFTTQVSSSGTLMGTPAYLSPEQILGHTQDTRSDLFSLGVILYEMITGVQPFNGSSVSAVCAQIVAVTPAPPSHHNPSLPAAFDHIVMRCLAKDPAKRYPTAEALGASLYSFAHGKEATLDVSETVSPVYQSMQGAQLWVAAALKTLNSTVKDWSRRLSAVAATFWSADSHWWNRPMWAAGAAVLAVISMVPIARALRDHSHQEPVVAARISTPVTSPVAANLTAEALITSNASMINVGSSLMMDPPVVNLDTDITASDNSAADSPNETANLPVLVRHAIQRHPLSVTKSQPARPASAKSPTLTHNLLPADGASLPVSSPVVKALVPAVIPQTTLRIDIVSGVKDQTLAIYSGDELLLTTPLQPAHLGDTLRFNCPITAGQHALRVVLYRGDKTVLINKENNSELHADGTNTMEVHVNRRSKMLVKHETSLEVMWPSSTAL